MGLPIFYYESDLSLSGRDMQYGSNGFKKVTKLKSQVVLEVLKMGYDVTWCVYLTICCPRARVILTLARTRGAALILGLFCEKGNA